MRSDPQIGDQVFTQEGGEAVGAVRNIRAQTLRVYIENAGDFDVPMAAVKACHDGKVVLEFDQLSESLRDAIEHAHDAERPGL